MIDSIISYWLANESMILFWLWISLMMMVVLALCFCVITLVATYDNQNLPKPTEKAFWFNEDS